MHNIIFGSLEKIESPKLGGSLIHVGSYDSPSVNKEYITGIDLPDSFVTADGTCIYNNHPAFKTLFECYYASLPEDTLISCIEY